MVPLLKPHHQHHVGGANDDLLARPFDRSLNAIRFDRVTDDAIAKALNDVRVPCDESESDYRDGESWDSISVHVDDARIIRANRKWVGMRVLKDRAPDLDVPVLYELPSPLRLLQSSRSRVRLKRRDHRIGNLAGQKRLIAEDLCSAIRVVHCDGVAILLNTNENTNHGRDERLAEERQVGNFRHELDHGPRPREVGRLALCCRGDD